MTARVVRRRPEVYHDVIAAAEYIERDSADAALRFFDAVEATVAGLAAMPGKGAVRQFESPRLEGIRAWAVEGFENYLLFYRWTEPTIVVLAILHGARDLPPLLERRA